MTDPPQTPEIPVIRLSLLLLAILASAAVAQDLAVSRGPVVHTLIEAGEIEAIRSEDLVAPGDWRSEPMVVFLAPEGTQAAEGDTLVRFDTAEILSQIRTAEAGVERKQAEIQAKLATQKQTFASLRSALRNAEFAAEQAQLRMERMEFSAETERQSARLSLETAQLRRDEAHTKLTAQATLDSLDLVQLRTELVTANADLEREREQLDRMVLIAPSSGLVIHGETGDDRKVREGDRVSAGETVVTLPDLSALRVKLGVHEVDRVHMIAGLPVRVSFDAYPDLVLDGHVETVAQLARWSWRRSRIQLFDVWITVDTSDPRLRPGMSARAEIETARRDDVLRVPREALAIDDDAIVVVLANGDSRSVTVGLVTEHWVELVDGPPAGTALKRPVGLEPFTSRPDGGGA